MPPAQRLAVRSSDLTEPADSAAGEALLINGPSTVERCLILAHGAGQGPRSPFVDSIALDLAARGITVIRFAFPYMRRIEGDGRRRPPDREPVLMDSWRRVLRQIALPPERVFIGGKSMGGRIASLIADDVGVAGLICLGYPFHPPGHPDRLRGRHLAQLQTPTLICQGERDPFGTRTEVAGYVLSSAIQLVWIGDGEHSFKPRKRSGRTQADNLAQAAAAVAEFVGRRR